MRKAAHMPTGRDWRPRRTLGRPGTSRLASPEGSPACPRRAARGHVHGRQAPELSGASLDPAALDDLEQRGRLPLRFLAGRARKARPDARIHEPPDLPALAVPDHGPDAHELG